MNSDELVALLERMGDEPSDEEQGLSALDHGLQCAWELSRTHPDDIGLALAGLVHDVGHAFGPDEEHDRLGAAFVRAALGDRAAWLVGAHVVAKRYLVATDPTYEAQLSATSIRTLALQGGALDGPDVERFARHPHAADALALRRADEAAKIPGRAVPPLERWVPDLQAMSSPPVA